ncbi:MAG: nucleotidyl transferase AbiEii/AbiGii toxin family protein [Patescibacteria group bacterium]
MITQEQINNLSKKWQIDQFSVLREYIQILFLSYFYENKLAENIYFKGGTALRLLFNSFRFSEDLDFTAPVSQEDLEKMLEKTIDKLKAEIKEISVNPLEKKGQGLSSKLKYKPAYLSIPLTVKLDFSQREESLDSQTSVIKTLFPVLVYPVINHYSLKEIMAEKIRAIITRTQGRDLFDLWFLLSKEIEIDWQMVDKKMEYYNGKTNKQEVVKKITKWNQDELKQDLNKFLPRPQRIIIDKLKDEILKMM